MVSLALTVLLAVFIDGSASSLADLRKQPWLNNYGEHFNFTCGAGHSINALLVLFGDTDRDTRFKFSCRPRDGLTSNCVWRDANKVDNHWYASYCPGDEGHKAVTGVSSFGDSDTGFRVLQSRCCYFTDGYEMLENRCRTIFLERTKTEGELVTGEYVSGAETWPNKKYYAFYVCTIGKKATSAMRSTSTVTSAPMMTTIALTTLPALTKAYGTTLQKGVEATDTTYVLRSDATDTPAAGGSLSFGARVGVGIAAGLACAAIVLTVICAVWRRRTTLSNTTGSANPPTASMSSPEVRIEGESIKHADYTESMSSCPYESLRLEDVGQRSMYEDLQQTRSKVTESMSSCPYESLRLEDVGQRSMYEDLQQTQSKVTGPSALKIQKRRKEK